MIARLFALAGLAGLLVANAPASATPAMPHAPVVIASPATQAMNPDIATHDITTEAPAAKVEKAYYYRYHRYYYRPRFYRYHYYRPYYRRHYFFY